MSLKLYELSEQYQRIADLTDSEEGDSESLGAMLDGIEEQIKDKVLAIGGMIKNMSAERDALCTEIANLVARERRINKKIDYLKDYIKLHMQQTGLSKVNGLQYDVTLRNNPERVNIWAQEEIPQEYITTEHLIKIDKNKIKNDLKSGKQVGGCELIRDRSVQIK